MGAMNEFRILDPNGHARTAWDPQSPVEVEKARRLFDELMKRGYRAFRMNDDGERPGRAFDPREKETLFVPPIHSG